jgi:glycosyltransferase involved in cell wall biosynthesis
MGRSGSSAQAAGGRSLISLESRMDTLPLPLLEPVPMIAPGRNGHHASGPGLNGFVSRARSARPPDPEVLRRVAWDIGQARAADAHVPLANHVGLAMVSPYQGFAHWRIRQEWIDQTAWSKGEGWRDCRLVLRLYDVSYILFNGLNAHRIQDVGLPRIDGHLFFNLPKPGTWQLGEVGFVLRNGEFLPAARSQGVQFAPDAVSPRSDHAALLVTPRGQREEVGNLWEQDKILLERRQPRLRRPLRIAAFAFGACAAGQEDVLGRFVTELAMGQAAEGHEVHVFLPASAALPGDRVEQGVNYQAVEVAASGNPLEMAVNFARAAEKRLQVVPPFDLFHLHEWMTGLAPWIGSRPTVLSLSSVEAVRRNGTPASPLSLDIQQVERSLAHAVDCILTPPWLRDQAVAELGLDGAHVHPFAMEARLANEWELPLDYGQVKMQIGVGPLDRLVTFVGPLEYGAGVDLLLEAMPTLLRRAPNLRLALAGDGHMYGQLRHRAHELGVAHAVRLLGHVEGPLLPRLLRSCEALVLPSRHRVCFDDAVVDLARHAGRPVVTTHGGPAHLVRHEETGIVTYDNPGSMVWALDRILGDPIHAERMGRNGQRRADTTVSWGEVARRYLELCAACFPELTEPRE